MTMNSMASIRLTPEHDVVDSRKLWGALVNPTGTEGLTYWDKNAVRLLVGAGLHNLYRDRDANMRSVLTLLSQPEDGLQQELRRMASATHDATSPEDVLTAKGWVDQAGGPTRTHPLVAQIARDLLDHTGLDRGSIVATAVGYLQAHLN